jgi:hypothetical protein
MTQSTRGTSGSLLEGIEFEKRRPVDADWSKRKRAAVGVAAALLAIAAVSGGGYLAWQHRPVSLPASAEEAIAVISSGRIDRLPPDRQTQYYAEAARLLRDVPREQWREVFREEDREAIGRVFQEQMEENLRQIARGGGMPEMPGFGRPFGQRPGGDGERRPRDGEPGGERPAGDDASRTDRRQRFASRLQQSFQNGDAQRDGLMGEFFIMMRARAESEGATGGGPR